MRYLIKCLLQKSWLVLRFGVVPKLNMCLDSSEFAGLVLGDGVRTVDDSIASLHIEQIQLNRISRIDVLVREEEFPLEENCFRFIDTLFPQGLAYIDPND